MFTFKIEHIDGRVLEFHENISQDMANEILRKYPNTPMHYFLIPNKKTIMSNTRQPGYYWVKVRGENERPTNWTSIRWSTNGHWIYHGNPIHYPEDKWLSEINETRILTPDEIKSFEDAANFLKKNTPTPQQDLAAAENKFKESWTDAPKS